MNVCSVEQVHRPRVKWVGTEAHITWACCGRQVMVGGACGPAVTRMFPEVAENWHGPFRPQRVQLSRAKGWRKPEGCISVARPSRWGNPYVVGQVVHRSLRGSMDGPEAGRYDPNDVRWFDAETTGRLTAQEAVDLYRQGLEAMLDERGDGDLGDEVCTALDQLRGHDLACWCPLEDAHGNRVPCHADVLLTIANAEATS